MVIIHLRAATTGVITVWSRQFRNRGRLNLMHTESEDCYLMMRADSDPCLHYSPSLWLPWDWREVWPCPGCQPLCIGQLWGQLCWSSHQKLLTLKSQPVTLSLVRVMLSGNAFSHHPSRVSINVKSLLVQSVRVYYNYYLHGSSRNWGILVFLWPVTRRMYFFRYELCTRNKSYPYLNNVKYVYHPCCESCLLPSTPSSSMIALFLTN